MKSKDWINIYDKDNPKNGVIAICESGRSDLLTYWYATKEMALSDMNGFTSWTGNKCLGIIEI